MKATDLRNATFHGLREYLPEARKQVYMAFVEHGPGTTREVAEKSGIDILTLRPRTTELCEIGLIELSAAAGGEGIYRARPQSDWERWRQDQIDPQQQLI